MTRIELTIGGMTCASCAARIEKKLNRLDGVSATVNYAGSGLLYVFSSNAHPFEDGKGYTKFAAFALLAHGGDFAQAARQLADEGYGHGRPGLPVGRRGRGLAGPVYTIRGS